MKIAIFSDIHDNLARWEQAAAIIKKEGIEIGVCCGDVASPDTLEKIASGFRQLFFALGNADYKIAIAPELIPKNTKWFKTIGAFELGGKKIAIVHNDKLAKTIAEEGKYDLVFYGHTHTPWEEKKGKTTLINPGEIAGHFGPASFCIFNLDTMKAKLYILK
jgi:putative phosphoesterase